MKNDYINNEEKELMGSLDEINLSQIKHDKENSELEKTKAINRINRCINSQVKLGN